MNARPATEAPMESDADNDHAGSRLQSIAIELFEMGVELHRKLSPEYIAAMTEAYGGPLSVPDWQSFPRREVEFEEIRI